MKSNLTQIEKLNLKRSIKAHCIAVVQQRISTIQQAMRNAQDSANSEEKSSVGDKYEVGRAMGHMELEMLSTQLDEAEHDMSIIHAVNADMLHDQVSSGAVVISGELVFFILLGLGAIMVNNRKVIVLSPVAPLSHVLMQKYAGNKFIFNKKNLVIEDVF